MSFKCLRVGYWPDATLSSLWTVSSPPEKRPITGGGTVMGVKPVQEWAKRRAWRELVLRVRKMERWSVNPDSGGRWEV